MNPEPSLAPADETAIRAIVQAMMDGWNAHQAEIFAAPFMDNADYVIVDGRHIHGRAAIQAGHAAIFSTFYRESHIEYTVEQIRLLRTDVALTHVRARLTYPVAGEEHVAHARISLVLLKENGEWQIAAFQNTSIQQP
ncbi:MAG: SgcJ/EcaC family oxidoreductase [Candidatus Promineifilaceae bacterium]